MLKSFFSFNCAAVFIGMGFQSSCLVGAFDFGDVGICSNAQHFVMCLWRVMRHFGCYMLVEVKLCVDLCVDG